MMVIFGWCMTGMFAVTFLMMGIESLVYERLVKETQDMQHTSVHIFKQIKMKYEGMCRIGRNVNNTRNFVDKIMLSWKICGIRYDILRRFEKLVMVAFGYTGVVAAMYLYYKRGFCRECVILSAGGIMVGLALKMWEITLDVEYKKEKMLIMVTDYLENQMHTGKVQNVQDAAMVQAAATVENEKDSHAKDDEKNKKTKNTVYEESLINEVLNEYLK